MANEIITQQQHDMITMIIEGENITDIAKRLNINRNTVYNWMKKDYIMNELDKRTQELARQGNRVIAKDLVTYINNIKQLANDKSDKRVCLAANQYLINRIYGNPKDNLDIYSEKETIADNQDVDILKMEISKFRRNNK